MVQTGLQFVQYCLCSFIGYSFRTIQPDLRRPTVEAFDLAVSDCPLRLLCHPRFGYHPLTARVVDCQPSLLTQPRCSAWVVFGTAPPFPLRSTLQSRLSQARWRSLHSLLHLILFLAAAKVRSLSPWMPHLELPFRAFRAAPLPWLTSTRRVRPSGDHLSDLPACRRKAQIAAERHGYGSRSVAKGGSCSRSPEWPDAPRTLVAYSPMCPGTSWRSRHMDVCQCEARREP